MKQRDQMGGCGALGEVARILRKRRLSGWSTRSSVSGPGNTRNFAQPFSLSPSTASSSPAAEVLFPEAGGLDGGVSRGGSRYFHKDEICVYEMALIDQEREEIVINQWNLT